MSKWAQYGVYAYANDSWVIFFRCSTVPAEDLTFTVTQMPVGAIGGFTGYSNTVTGYTQYATVLTIPDGVDTIDENAFYNNEDIEEVILPQNMHIVRARAFAGCTALETIHETESDDVHFTSIAAEAFAGCTALSSIAFYYGYSSHGARLVIADGAFTGCTGLTSITFKKSLAVRKEMFTGCENVTEIIFGDDWYHSADFTFTDKLTATALGNMLTQLADLTGLSGAVLTIGATNLSRLTAEQIAAAEAKNWTVV